MYKYLEGKLSIERPIAFLCGPYFDKNNPNDRRTVLLNFLENTYNSRVISLIIDDFLVPENIRDESINIQLLEEVFAAISNCTYIFLDTMSAASELGLFANHSTKNEIHVFLPYASDILDNKVGYFVKNIVIDQNKEKIKLDYYRPKILKRAIATDYVVEHYEFINSKIPDEIANRIKENSFELKNNVVVNNSSSTPHDFGCINYVVNNSKIVAKLSMKTLFYLVASFIYIHFKKDELKNKKLIKCTDEIISEVIEKLKSTIRYTIDIHEFGVDFNTFEIEIKSNVSTDFHQVIKHIIKFISLYHENEPRNGHLFTNQKDSFLKNIHENQYKGLEVLAISVENYKLLEDIISNWSLYFNKFEISKNRKTRTLYTYIDSELGEKTRNLHRFLREAIEKNFIYSTSSYAYQKGKSVVSCTSVHLNSNYFVKFDIKSFFNSINIDKLCFVVMSKLGIDEAYFDQMKKILRACSIEDSVQLGLSMSPVLSEIYLSEFDSVIGEYAESASLVYTRYADDILVSSTSLLSTDEVNKIQAIIKAALKPYGLKVNKSKFRTGSIDSIGKHFKYLGVNIVQKEEGRYLTVGKAYKNYVAKRYMKYLSIRKDDPENHKKRFYESRRIAGQLSYIKQIEGMDGYWQVIERIKKSTGGRVDITTPQIEFGD